MNELQHKRVGFYPVSARDYLEPLQMLKGYVDRLIFCDISCTPRGLRELRELRQTASDEGLPEPLFFLGDALAAMECLKPIDIFFLRKDSGDGEGGSGLYLLGRERLPKTLSLIKPGGLLITDDRNGGDWFKQMVSRRCEALETDERTLRLAETQPWAGHKLFVFNVDRTP